MSTHNLCFRAKVRKIVYPCTPPSEFYYIKVGCKGVFVTRTCFRDAKGSSHGVLPHKVTDIMNTDIMNKRRVATLNQLRAITLLHIPQNRLEIKSWLFKL